MDKKSTLRDFTDVMYVSLMKETYGIRMGCNVPGREYATQRKDVLPLYDTDYECSLCEVSRNPKAATLYLDLFSSVAMDSKGNMYIADSMNCVIRKVNRWNIISTVAGTYNTSGYTGDGGPARKATFAGIRGLAMDSSDNLYIADAGNNVIRRIDTTIWTISTFAGIGTYGYSGDGSSALFAELATPSGIAFDSTGNLYIADSDNCVIRMIDTAGDIDTVAGTGIPGYTGDGGPATTAKLWQPQGICTDYLGNFYIADSTNNAVRYVDSSGNINTVAGNGTPGYSGDGGTATAAFLNYPVSVSCDTRGNVYIADFNNYCVRYYDIYSGLIATVGGTGLSPGYSGDGGIAWLAKTGKPAGLYVDYFGEVFIADVSNHVIRKIDFSRIMSTYAGKGTAGYSGDNGPAAYYTQTGINIHAQVATNAVGAVTKCIPYPPVSICYPHYNRRQPCRCTKTGTGASGIASNAQ